MIRVHYQNSPLSVEGNCLPEITGQSEFYQSVQKVFQLWYSDQDTFSLKTSGSTGEQKKISFNRQQLINSAQRTIDFFGLTKNNNLLCCLSPEHAAGLMMIIRALVLDGGLILLEPDRNPIIQLDKHIRIDFAAFVPYQFSAIIDNPKSLTTLDGCKAVILGGASVSSRLAEKIMTTKCPVYHTYGMTETLTHIALRRMNGRHPDKFFKPLKGVRLSTNTESCLVIETDDSPGTKISTNDLVRLNEDQSFEYLGRNDRVINSGGFKIHTEQLTAKTEELIHSIFGEADFFYYALPDEELGQKLILLIELDQWTDNLEINLKILLKEKLSKFEVPKSIYPIKKFERTSIGKIDQLKTILNIGRYKHNK
jgi:O-succinylbenzoic acid--CoA ligase